MKKDIRTITQVALCAVLMIIGGKISIPFLTIPFTLQTTACLLTGMVLGAHKALLALSAYLLLGLSGLPVFAGGGGPAYILQPSFGYLLGMVLAAGLVGSLTGKLDPQRTGPRIGQSLAVNLGGMLAIHLLGIGYLFALNNFYLGKPMTFLYVVQIGMLPFLVTDSLQCLLAAVTGRALRRASRLYFPAGGGGSSGQPGPAGPL